MFAGASAVPAQEPAELRIAAVGDIMLGGSGAPEFQRFGYDYPFDKTRALLKQSHIVFGNLEGPLTHADHAPVAKKYLYRSPPEKVAPACSTPASTSSRSRTTTPWTKAWRD